MITNKRELYLGIPSSRGAWIYCNKNMRNLITCRVDYADLGLISTLWSHRIMVAVHCHEETLATDETKRLEKITFVVTFGKLSNLSQA